MLGLLSKRHYSDCVLLSHAIYEMVTRCLITKVLADFHCCVIFYVCADVILVGLMCVNKRQAMDGSRKRKKLNRAHASRLDVICSFRSDSSPVVSQPPIYIKREKRCRGEREG